MLDYLNSISYKIAWTKPISLLMGFLFIILFFLSIFDVDNFQNDTFLIPSILGLLWSAVLFNFITIFNQLPSTPTRDIKFLKRLKIQLLRFMLYILRLIFIVLTVIVAWLSLRLFGVWL